MNDAERKVIIDALILVYDNEQTSAHRLGLERRAVNLDKIEKMLCRLVGLTEDELDDMYWEHIREQGR